MAKLGALVSAHAATASHPTAGDPMIMIDSKAGANLLNGGARKATDKSTAGATGQHYANNTGKVHHGS